MKNIVFMLLFLFGISHAYAQTNFKEIDWNSVFFNVPLNFNKINTREGMEAMSLIMSPREIKYPYI